ncbi:MAG: hypothetical protein P1V97_05135 [Planctomycetota bacterium]|nr:hypothetical protein [Planctomycetota bacterium]
MLSYGKARLRTNRVLLVLGLSYVAVATLAYHSKEIPESRPSELMTKVSELEDRCVSLQRALKLKRRTQPVGAKLCLPDSTGPTAETMGFPLPTKSFSLERLVPINHLGDPRHGKSRTTSFNFTRATLEDSHNDQPLLADGIELTFVFGENEKVSFGALMKSWEHALGQTVVVSEILAQSIVRIETDGSPSMSWGTFKMMMSGQGIGFLEQHVGKNVFVISTFKEDK